MNLHVDIKHCNTNQLLLHGWDVKVSESLHTQVVIWVNTILNYIDITAVLPRHKDSCIGMKTRMRVRTKIPSNILTRVVLKNVKSSL